jgi:eukaryotic-like serine/threonine-protein kinase
MLIGTTVSHYRIVELLGAGGMGEVYKAEDTRLKRAVALKFLPPALIEDREARQRLVAEAQAASALDHPNICTIHEIDETADGRVFLAMAYYEGETLKQRIDRGALELGEALEIIGQVGRAVAAAHDAGIIHRDVKPANIFLCASGAQRARQDTSPTGSSSARVVGDSARVKLLDFGIAKQPGRTALTKTGTTIGTVAYMSPEHIEGHAIDERADVWSLGVLLYELVTGRLPFTGPHEIAVIKAIGYDDPPPLSAARPDAPPALDSIVRKALQKDPQQRYMSVHDLLRDLDALRPGTRSIAASGATEPVAPRVGLSRRTVAYAAAAFIVAVGAGGWAAWRAMQAREVEQLASEIRRLVESEQNAAAIRRLYSVPSRVANDAVFAQLRNDYFMPLTVTTEPSGADVYVKGYDEPDADWIHLGRTPIQTRGTIGASGGA